MLKLFKLAIELSITKRRLNHLIQRIAILNHDVDENTENRLKNIENQDKE
jgi:hypothetical protein